MIRDRCLLWLITIAMAVLLVAQLIGGAMLAHWQSQDEKLSRPDPAVVRLLAPDK